MYTEKCLATSTFSENVPRGIVCLQTDDTMYARNKAFSEKEERLSKVFDSKTATFLEYGKGIKFNGAVISRHNHTYAITQRDHIVKLNIIDVKNAVMEDFAYGESLPGIHCCCMHT